MNFSLGDSSFLITSNDYKLEAGWATRVCGGNYEGGQRAEENYIYSIEYMILEELKKTSLLI